MPGIQSLLQVCKLMRVTFVNITLMSMITTEKINLLKLRLDLASKNVIFFCSLCNITFLLVKSSLSFYRFLFSVVIIDIKVMFTLCRIVFCGTTKSYPIQSSMNTSEAIFDSLFLIEIGTAQLLSSVTLPQLLAVQKLFGTVSVNTYPICDSPFQRSAQCSFSPLQRSRHHYL